jgi:outer membrane protein, multidrug efflux system
MKVLARFSNSKHLKHVIARAIACSMLLVLPACIPIPRRPEPGPGLPASFQGATSSENSSQLGIEEFYNDPLLICLIHQALAGNRELKILNEDVQIAENEVLARSGAYLPFVGLGANAGLDRYSRFTLPGAGLINDPYLPGKFFPNPMGNFGGGINLSWRLDIYRQLRNARDAAALRYVAATDRRNFFVTRLVADIAENYYGLVALDKRLENLDLTIELQERSLEVAKALLQGARGTELGVQRFQAEVRKNQSEKLIVNQDIIEVENRINFLVNRFPQPVERKSAGFSEFFDLKIHTLSVGVPSQLLQNRPDIRQAERDLAAAGLDVKVARVNFFPQLTLTGGVGLDAFNLRYLFEPTAVAGGIAGGVVGPLINFRAIKADYLTANARQLQSIYNYQRVILEAFTQVINRLTMVENYRKSIEIKKQQLEALVVSVEIASRLFQNPRENSRVDYMDVLFAQRDMMDARRVLIDTKREQLSAVVNAYQALGGGLEHRHSPNDSAVPAPPDVAAAARAPAMPATTPNDPANPDVQPGKPKTPQSESATDLPPAIP